MERLPKPLRTILTLLRDAAREWQEDRASNLAAALAYHTAFSLAPLLVIIFGIAGFFWGTEAVQAHFLRETARLIGPEGAELIQNMVSNAASGNRDVIAMIIGAVTLLFGATGAFTHLRTALNIIWDVPQESIPSGLGAVARSRALSFGLLLTVGFLLLVSLILSAAISAMGDSIRGLFPSAQLLLTASHFVVSVGLITVLFALLYRWLPDANVQWRDVWAGAAMTAILFTIGKALIGFYLGNSSLSSTYGAAASFAIILVWFYYSAQIFFFGAELTQVHANRYGSRIGFGNLPDEPAVEATQAATEADTEDSPEKVTAQGAATAATPEAGAEEQPAPAEMPRWLTRQQPVPAPATPLATAAVPGLFTGAQTATPDYLSQEERSRLLFVRSAEEEGNAPSLERWAWTGVGGLLVMMGLFAGYWFGQRIGQGNDSGF